MKKLEYRDYGIALLRTHVLHFELISVQVFHSCLKFYKNHFQTAVLS